MTTHPVIEAMARAACAKVEKDNEVDCGLLGFDSAEAFVDACWPSYVPQQRAALAAVLESMKPPSGEQIKAGLEASAPPPDETLAMIDCLDFSGENSARRLLSASWQAMLGKFAEEALKDE